MKKSVKLSNGNNQTQQQLEIFSNPIPNHPSEIGKSYTAKIKPAANIGYLPLASIQLNPDLPRKQIDVDKLNDIASSIGAKGILQPVIVSKGKDGIWTLVAGKVRFLGAQLAGLQELPVIETHSDHQEIALIENLMRSDLSAIDESEALCLLKESKNYNLEQLSNILKKSQSILSETMSLAKLSPEAKDLCREHFGIPKRFLIKLTRSGLAPDEMIDAINGYIDNSLQPQKPPPSRPKVKSKFKLLGVIATRLQTLDVSKVAMKNISTVRDELKELRNIIDKKLIELG